MDIIEIKANLIEALWRIKRVHIELLFNDISKNEFFALEMLNKFSKFDNQNSDICVSQLAKNLKMSSPATSRMLNNLEEKGLIIRTIDKNNRRNTFVSLTDLGKQRTIDNTNILNEYIENVISNMGEEKVMNLIFLINEMTNIMEKEINKNINDK